MHFEETVTPDAAENLDQSVHSYNPGKAVTQKIQLVLEPEEITQPGDATESKPLVDEVPVPVHSLPGKLLFQVNYSESLNLIIC